MNIGASIKEIRTKAGISQQDLATKAGVSQTALSQIENGVKSPNTKTLEKICEALNTPIALIYVLAMQQSDVPADKKDDYDKIYPYLRSMVLEMVSSKK